MQGEDKNENQHPKVMVKAAVVFDGRSKLSINAKIPRYELSNSYSYASTTGAFWSSVHDQLNERYDLSKVKQIYLLGDGATWITAGVNELSTSNTSVIFALDKFHAGQAIQRITKDKTLATVLTQYMIANMKESFIEIVNILITDYPDKAKQILQNSNYILIHWQHIQTMYKTVKIGCAMEQAISHNIASVFSSVPKAYSKKYFETYLCNRINHLNKFDLRKLYLTALDIKSDDHHIRINQTYDFSFFNTKNLNPTYPLHLNHSSFKDITKF